MADTNSNQKPQHNSPQDAQKPGLSWTQPVSSKQPQLTSQPAAPTKKVTEGSSTGRVVGIILGAVIVLALVAWGIVALRNRSHSSNAPQTASNTQTTPQASQGTTPENASQGATASAPTATFSISAQDAGTSVAITDLKLGQPTWLIVYESRNGKPGNILGAGLFFPSDTSASVPLMRGTSAGQTYYVTAAADNGDHLFSLSDEQSIVGADGQQVWTTFEAH